MMASLRFKDNGTPYVDFRCQSKRFRPEFESVKEATKFLRLANVSPVEAYDLWMESTRPDPVIVVAPRLNSSLKEIIESFKLNYCAKRVSSKDMEAHITRFKDFVIKRASAKGLEQLDDIDIGSLSLDDFESFQTELLNKGLAPASVNRMLATVKTFNKRALKAGHINVNYAAMVDTLRVEVELRDAWRLEDFPLVVSELEKNDSDQVLIDIVQSMKFSPFGPKDFSRLKWSSINFTTGEINTFRLKGKGKREWNVPLILGYQKLLLEIKKRHEKKGFGKPNDFIYLDRAFKQVKPSWISKSLERSRKKAKVVGVPYSSRHRIITDVANKTDRDTASKFAGHASVKTTEKHYLVGGNKEFRNKVKGAFAE